MFESVEGAGGLAIMSSCSTQGRWRGWQTHSSLSHTHAHIEAGYCTLVLHKTGFDLCTCRFMSSHSTFSLPQSSPLLPSYNLSSFSCLLPSVFLLLSFAFFFSRLPPPLLSKNHPFLLLLLLLFPPPISFQLFLIPRFWFYVRCIVMPMCEMYFKRCRVLDVVIDIAANSKEFLIHADTHTKKKKKSVMSLLLCVYIWVII